MSKLDTNFSADQWRVGRYLDISPDKIGDSLDMIDKLLLLEKHKGKQELLREISRMMGGI